MFTKIIIFSTPASNLIVMEHEVDISRPLCVVSHKMLVSRRPFSLVVTRQHRLQTDAYTLHILNRAPALAVQQVKTDDAVGVDVWVKWDGVLGVAEEDHLWSLQSGRVSNEAQEIDMARACKRETKYLNGIALAEGEFEPVDLALIYGVCVYDAYVHEPFCEIICFDEFNAWRECALKFLELLKRVISSSSSATRNIHVVLVQEKPRSCGAN